MKIKTKKQLNLPQLIEWGFKNPKEAESKVFESDNIDYFWNTANVQFSNDGCGVRINSSVSVDDTFTVEVEEEITEDTEFKSIVEVTTDDLFAVWENASISTWKNKHSKEFHAYIDGEFKCIWRDGKLVE